MPVAIYNHGDLHGDLSEFFNNHVSLIDLGSSSNPSARRTCVRGDAAMDTPACTASILRRYGTAEGATRSRIEDQMADTGG